MKKALQSVKFGEMENKVFEVMLITERLCEICDRIVDTKEKVMKTVHVIDRRDYDNLLMRVKVYDRAEVDIENNKIYFYNHDYPGDVHPSCIEKL
ncbi:MAG: hypothetical protein OEY39_02725 [Candidatus Bathyarchaeota archaeon]|nr:hypothetical protein [Candidatus Bathyarchaeota archaeon]MDH5418835.1 hypothetical protein [Candidatus Bathyarchaeota archaeon]MDH5623362.1 hypothetical protein [Candidatus Bathyarchaeota archaeon]MDH5635093.1 hypothetical protein [Candidatus Bathyarchaeota archaeon]